MTFDQRRASSSAAASPRLMPIHSAVSATAANATPKHARMMWNPSEDPICDRAGTGSTAITCANAPIKRPLSAATGPTLQSRRPMCTATPLRVHVTAPVTHIQRNAPPDMRNRNIGAVALVIVLGLIVGTLGLLAAALYGVGVLILFIGGVGAIVLVGDYLIRYNRTRRPRA